MENYAQQPRIPRRALASLAVAGTVLSWAAAFPLIRFALREIEPLSLAGIRFAIAAIPALIWLLWSRPALPSRRDLALLGLCSFCGIAAYNLLLNAGQVTVSAGAASFVVNTQPLFMVVLAVLFLQERFSRWSWFGAALGIAGVGLIASGQPGGIALGKGASLIVIAAFCSAVFSVGQRPLMARMKPLDVTAILLIGGACLLLPWIGSGARAFGQAGFQTQASVIFLGIVPAAIGQTCWTFAIKEFGAARAGQFLYLIPPCALTLSWIFLGETPEWTTLIGGVLALTGVIVVNTLGRRFGGSSGGANDRNPVASK